jgi:hypothetical protein
MPITISRGLTDETLEAISAALRMYEASHTPPPRIDLYRQNSVSVRIRVVDSAFRGLDRAQRSALVWKYLDALTDDAQADISMLLLLTPEETERSFANFEFDDPIPSTL